MKKKEMVRELDLFSSEDFGENPSESFASEAPVDKDDKAPVVKDDKASVMSCDIAQLFLRLSHSKFRSSFYLNQKDKDIIAKKGLSTIREHARQIIAKRLAPAVIPNDGKQTPMRHGTSPVFIAQHATGCCCRGCLEKWHRIPKGRALTQEEQAYVVDVLMHWITRAYE